ncbi:MAG: hypothetical protein N2Z58_05695 [Fervidobacterium sp.]|nr:hypothetical protein [Fervidobacterium sp.]
MRRPFFLLLLIISLNLLLSSILFGNIKACIVSIGQYRDNQIIPLPEIFDDSIILQNALIGMGINKNNISYLENPSTKNLSSKLTEIFSNARSSDKILLYIAFHGFVVGDNIYLLMSDTVSSSLEKTSYNLSSELKRLLGITQVNEIIIILNTSYSENIIKDKKTNSSKINRKSIESIIGKKSYCIYLTFLCFNRFTYIITNKR